MIAIVAAGIGVALGFLAFNWNINLVEGSVVDPSIRGTPTHMVFVLLCFPGLVGAMFLGLIGIVLGQLAVYWPLGAIMESIRRDFRR